ncbi:MAG TPA: hypothetical protein VHE12_10975 [bacterium]|nr:hypothetical protein [bacterium]
MNWFLLLLLLPSLFPSSLLASGQDFSYDGKPIHPSCLGELVEDEGKESVDLSKCKVDWKGVETRPQGMIEFEDMDPKDGEDGGRHPFSAYRFVGKFGDNYIVLYQWGGGGTGIFSGLAGVRIEGRTLLKVFNVLGGDRCNGGLLSAKAENGRILAEVNVTPYDLMSLRLGPEKLEGLQSCSICCAAVATFEVDPGTGTSRLVGVDLGSDLEDVQTDPAEVGIQDCFNRLYNTYIRSKRSKLDPRAFDGFVKEFEKAWLKGLPEKK